MTVDIFVNKPIRESERGKHLNGIQVIQQSPGRKI